MIWNREKLYLEVWQSPLSRLAAKLGVSGTSLKETCVNADIPLPPLGYWNKLAAGKPVPTRPPLGPSSRRVERAQFPGPRPTAESPIPKSDSEAVTASVSLLAVPKTLRNPHPLVARLRDDADFRRKHVGMISNGAMLKALQIEELTAIDQRRLRILDTLFKELSSRSWQIKLEPSRHFAAVHDDGQIVFRLNEPLRQETIKSPPPANAFEQLIWSPTTQIFHRTDHLVFELYGRGSRRRWKDSEKARIEECLPEILRSFLLGAILQKEGRQQRQLREEQMAEVTRGREMARIEQQQEKTRWAALLGASVAWQDAATARAFIDELAARIENPHEPIQGKPTSEWLEWARRRIAETDPLTEGATTALRRIVGES